MAPRVTNWKEQPDDHDYPAAESYLTLLMPPREAKKLMLRMRKASLQHWKAKDLLRASRLPVLPRDNFHVAADLKKVRARQKLSPVLLVRGRIEDDTPLQIADGYHRICASYYLDEDSDIPCRLTDAEKG
ncbi:MAG TPA: hypothetical protein VNA65_02910 [Candidatus Dormibacteraeota bacterium]|nr:hypothetical protein [Candidatus Dormibacteraeota bacterium]